MDEHPDYFSKRRPLKCPNCGARKVVSILYGLPSSDVVAEVTAGKVVLGGCCVTDCDPSWECTDCGTQIYEENLRSRLREIRSYF